MNKQIYDNIEEKYHQDEDKKKKQKMKVSGKSVFELQKILKRKNAKANHEK